MFHSKPLYGRLTQTHIGNGHLCITSPHGDSIAEILRNACHLYEVIHILEFTNAAKLVSAMELHCCLRHISVASAVKGITLDPNTPETDCEACIYTHTTCVPMSKPRISVPS